MGVVSQTKSGKIQGQSNKSVSNEIKKANLHQSKNSMETKVELKLKFPTSFSSFPIKTFSINPQLRFISNENGFAVDIKLAYLNLCSKFISLKVL